MAGVARARLPARAASSAADRPPPLAHVVLLDCARAGKPKRKLAVSPANLALLSLLGGRLPTTEGRVRRRTAHAAAGKRLPCFHKPRLAFQTQQRAQQAAALQPCVA